MTTLTQRILPIHHNEKFITKHAGRRIRDWKIALIELVANCWDAGASNVWINISQKPSREISITDDGTGMTQEEFERRWTEINYDRVSIQGIDVIFPDGKIYNRKAYGKKGVGRHAMFCFSANYFVETKKNGKKIKYEVIMTGDPFTIKMIDSEDIDKKEHGTKIWSSLTQVLQIGKEETIKLIGTKFISDPSFKIFVNNEQITLSSLGDVREKEKIMTDLGELEIHIYDTQKFNRTSVLNGIGWWVNYRLVGDFSWEINGKPIMDRRTAHSRLISFIILADPLKDYVKSDWTGFLEKKELNKIFEQVSDYIVKKFQIIFADEYLATKKEILKKYKKEIRKLSPLSNERIGRFLSEVRIRCPKLKDEDLDNILETMIRLETAISGYGLFDQLSGKSTEELDTFYDILNEWTVVDAKRVLDELNWRINLIKDIEQCALRKSDELHELQPLFERGLWLFGHEYDNARFTSNKTLSNIIKTLFHIELSKGLKKRPDFVAIPEGSIGTYSAVDLVDASMVPKITKVLIVELKKGTFAITQKAVNQAKDYAFTIWQHGGLAPNAKIHVYILGTTLNVGFPVEKAGQNDEIMIFPIKYDDIIAKGKWITFNLISEMKKDSRGKITDPEVNEILSEKTIEELMSDLKH